MGKLSETISRFVRAEPELLELLRDLQPLILMGSFSLVVATFAASLSPSAAGYAVGAAMGFLTAFSLILFGRLAKAIDKDFDSDYFVLSAYVSIGIGLILLFLVPGELGKSIPTVKTYSGVANTVGSLIFVVWITDLFATAAKRRAREHPTLTWSPFLVWIAMGGAWMMYGYLAVSSIFMEVSQSWIGPAFGISGIVLFIGGVLTEFTYRNRKLKRLSSASRNDHPS